MKAVHTNKQLSVKKAELEKSRDAVQAQAESLRLLTRQYLEVGPVGQNDFDKEFVERMFQNSRRLDQESKVLFKELMEVSDALWATSGSDLVGDEIEPDGLSDRQLLRDRIENIEEEIRAARKEYEDTGSRIRRLFAQERGFNALDRGGAVGRSVIPDLEMEFTRSSSQAAYLNTLYADACSLRQRADVVGLDG